MTADPSPTGPAGRRIGVRRRVTKIIVIAGLALAAFGAGTWHGKWVSGNRTSFHDTRNMATEEYVDLVDPKCPVVRDLARRCPSAQMAYEYVRDEIAFDPSSPAAPPGEIVRQGRASCLGKAILLCSLYRAQGVDHRNVRVMTGEVATPRALVEHAWLEIEQDGNCLQQDPTPLLGVFSHDQFPGNEYTEAFIRRKNFCFNDAGFALVSQLDTLPAGLHPPIAD